MIRKTRTVIDLGAIAHNYRALVNRMPSGTRVMPVVKADAYGHGIVEVSKAALSEGAAIFGVALVEEGLELRLAGIETDILVMGAAMKCGVTEAVRHNLLLTIFEPSMVALLEEEAIKQKKVARVHIKLDTGMGRIGLCTKQEAHMLAQALAYAPHVCVEGIYTHFADADHIIGEGMNEYSRQQLERFRELRSVFDPGLPAHVSNSAMSLVDFSACFQMVREGISLYGYPPVKTELVFRPALRWESEVVYVKHVPQGSSIGYGRTYIAPRDMRVATVAVGYGDGYLRAGSNRAQMLVKGCRASVVGRICMDQTMIDVTDIPGVHVGSTAILLGKQGNECIGADELGYWAGTIGYEVLLSITRRVPREYMDG